VREINRFATGGLEPDLTLLLRIHPAEGRARQAQRSLDPDRMEREAEEFFFKIAAAYEELAHAEPQRIVVIDAAQEFDRVLADALAAVEKLPALAPLPAD
jgi:dTMP kinase